MKYTISKIVNNGKMVTFCIISHFTKSITIIQKHISEMARDFNVIYIKNTSNKPTPQIVQHYNNSKIQVT